MIRGLIMIDDSFDVEIECMDGFVQFLEHFTYKGVFGPYIYDPCPHSNALCPYFNIPCNYKDEQYSYCGYAPYSFEIEVQNDGTGSESRNRVKELALLKDGRMIFMKRDFIKPDEEFDETAKEYIDKLELDDKEALNFIIDYFAGSPNDND